MIKYSAFLTEMKILSEKKSSGLKRSSENRKLSKKLSKKPSKKLFKKLFKKPHGRKYLPLDTYRNNLFRRRYEKRGQILPSTLSSKILFQSLFDNQFSACALHRIITDRFNHPIDYVFLIVNQSFQDITGLTPHHVIGKRVTELFPDIQASDFNWIETYGEVALKGETVKFENYFSPLHKWLSVKAFSPYKYFFITVFEDMTNYKEALWALHQSELRFRNMAETIQDGIAIFENDRCIYVNDRMAAIIGYRKEKMYKLNILDITPPSDKRRIAALLHNIRKNRAKITELTLWILRPDSSRRCIQNRIAYSHTLDEHQHSVLYVTTTDITDQAMEEERIRELNTRLEERVQSRTIELEAAYKELETFSYTVSHDLRSPLRSIDGYSNILAQDFKERLGSEGIDFLDRIKKSVHKMDQLIIDLLNFAKVSKRDIMLQTVDLSDLAEKVIKNIRSTVDRPKIEIVIQPALKAFCDQSLIRIALENLIGNAWKYTSKKEKAKIEIGNYYDEDELVYFIKDNGAGFQQEAAERIFGVFQRYHSSQEFEGTGIGLATVKKIIARHGGKIWAQGEVDQGCVFYFTLPNNLYKSSHENSLQ